MSIAQARGSTVGSTGRASVVAAVNSMLATCGWIRSTMGDEKTTHTLARWRLGKSKACAIVVTERGTSPRNNGALRKRASDITDLKQLLRA